MFGIIVLIMLAFYMGKRAEDKNKNRYVYWGLTVLVWFGAQFIVGILFFVLAGLITGNEPSDGAVTVAALIGSLIGYGLLYRYLDKQSDESDAERKIRELGMPDSEEDTHV
ncbi:MAG: hypothetical protein AAF587_14695 [Bacteroidota bacterium]